MTNKEKLALIYSNPKLWIETFSKIVDKEGKLVPFCLNIQQRELVENLDKYNVVLKSRQLGITSVSVGMSLYYALTQHDSHCLLISYSMDSADAIFDKLKSMFNALPSAIKVSTIANNRKELKFVNGSKITCTTMGNKEIARGSTLKFVHISEVGFCKEDALAKNLLALEQSLVPNGKIILESTANGLNTFSQIWEKAENKDSLYKPFFFSWVDDKLMFAKEYKLFLKRYKDLKGSALTLDMLEPNELTYYHMGASIEQLTWRRVKIMNSDEIRFKQEFPATPIEAFVTTGSNLFNADKVVELYNIVKSTKPLKKVENLPSELKMYENSYLKLWDTPHFATKYVMGVDASEGVGSDYNVIHIYDNNLMQVAEFRSNKTQPHEVAKVVYSLAIWYNHALVVVEKASGGHIVLDRLKNTYKYRNLYKHKDYDLRGKTIKKIGFNTNSKTKPIMINDFIELFENGDMYIKSLNLLNEMKTFEYNDGKMGAIVGKHDDTVMATALVIQGIKSGVRYR